MTRPRRARLDVPERPAELHLDLDGWYRRGGRRVSVHVTAEEFAAAVYGSLPAEWGPWRSTGSDRLPTGPLSGGQEHPWAADDVDLARDAVAADGRERFEVWLWSPRITADRPPLEVGSDYDMRCGYNGFVLLQNVAGPSSHGRDVTLVDAVYTRTGDLVEYPHYLSVWQRIARRLRAAANSPGPPQGHRHWDGYPWSPAAVAEALEDDA